MSCHICYDSLTETKDFPILPKRDARTSNGSFFKHAVSRICSVIPWNRRWQTWNSLNPRYAHFDDTDLNEHFENDAVAPPCGHTYHRKCLMDWYHIQPHCPCCRKNINLRKLQKLHICQDTLKSSVPDDMIQLPRKKFETITKKLQELDAIVEFKNANAIQPQLIRQTTNINDSRLSSQFSSYINDGDRKNRRIHDMKNVQKLPNSHSWGTIQPGVNNKTFIASSLSNIILPQEHSTKVKRKRTRLARWFEPITVTSADFNNGYRYDLSAGRFYEVADAFYDECDELFDKVNSFTTRDRPLNKLNSSLATSVQNCFEDLKLKIMNEIDEIKTKLVRVIVEKGIPVIENRRRIMGSKNDIQNIKCKIQSLQNRHVIALTRGLL